MKDYNKTAGGKCTLCLDEGVEYTSHAGAFITQPCSLCGKKDENFEYTADSEIFNIK